MLRSSLLPLTAFALPFALAAAPVHLAAQQPPAARPTASVSGVVYDSLARRPFALADVQLLSVSPGADGTPQTFTAAADSAGRFRIDGVPAGTYTAGFFHPTLDSLGLQAPLRQLEVKPSASTHLDLALPAAPRLVRSLCTTSSPSDTSALLVGFVRDATTRDPRPGATVQLAWTRLVLDEQGLQRRDDAVEVPTQPNGWFAACGVPAGTALRLRSYHGADTSGTLLLDPVAYDVIRRDLYLGSSIPVLGSRSPDSSAAEAGVTLRTGTGRLTGVVRSAVGAPVVGARVRLVDAPDSATTSEGGTFTLAALPSGSQTLDVRAVGFLPVRRAVDIVGEAPAASVEVRLTSYRAFLDTMKIINRRVYSVDRTGFEERRRSAAAGHFLTREAIDRFHPIQMTDILQMLPGVSIVNEPGSRYVMMGGRRRLVTLSGVQDASCRPTIYLDGMPITQGAPASRPSPLNLGGNGFGSTMSIIENLPPDGVEGVEVYGGAAGMPMRFASRWSGCGIILIWTRPPVPTPPRDGR